MMNKQDFLNTKWDARNWSEDEKRAWQEHMFSIGCSWGGNVGRSAYNLDAAHYFIDFDGGLSWSDHHEQSFFNNHHYKQMYWGDAFPKTEQGQKHDSDKPRYDLLPPVAIDEMAKVMTFGAKKYAPDNWRHVDNAAERYRAALLRHSFAMLRGENLDPETGLPHAAHAMCCAAFLVELDND